MSNISRQFGLHELPGTEEPAPQAKPRTVTAGFESQIRGYVDAIWLKIAELEGRIDDFEGWRTAIALALKDATGIDPRSPKTFNSPEPLLVSAAGEAKGERYGDEPGSTMVGVRAVPPKPRGAKPWEAEGVSKATWYRRHKEATA
jgi:hypothetical protein